MKESVSRSQILKENCTIAEFLDWQRFEEKEVSGYVRVLPNGKVEKVPVDELKFHESWDWMSIFIKSFKDRLNDLMSFKNPKFILDDTRYEAAMYEFDVILSYISRFDLNETFSDVSNLLKIISKK